MRRIAIALVLIMVLPSVLAVPEAITELTMERKLTDSDLGLNGGELSPDAQKVLIFGAEGYSRLIDANSAGDKKTDIELEKETSSDLKDASWHPRGLTALMVGDSGTVLRYVGETKAIEPVSGTTALEGKDLTTVMWRQAGDQAYVGANDGTLWSYSESNGFVKLDQDASSRITDIACHKSQNICVVASLNNGLAVVEKNDDVTWIARSKSHTWVGVACEDGSANYCSGFASGRKAVEIELIMNEPASSTIGEPIILGQLEGDLIGDSSGVGSESLLALGPLGLVRWNQYTGDAFLMFSNNDSTALDVLFGGDSFVVAWENSRNDGFIITDEGRIVSFIPSEEAVESGMLELIISIVVGISVPGVFLGMIYWNSPWLQRKYKAIFSKKRKS
jgi:WD40 repeat protein